MADADPSVISTQEGGRGPPFGKGVADADPLPLAGDQGPPFGKGAAGGDPIVLTCPHGQCWNRGTLRQGTSRKRTSEVEKPLQASEQRTDYALWFWEDVYQTSEMQPCPRKHSEAMSLPQAQAIRQAELSEFASHVQNGTFGPPLLPDQYSPGPVLKAVWVYSQSKKNPGAFKARVVIQGFLMQQGLHYNDVHAPVPAVTAFRVFMLGVAVQGRRLEHWDVKTAFLTTSMDCQIASRASVEHYSIFHLKTSCTFCPGCFLNRFE